MIVFSKASYSIQKSILLGAAYNQNLMPESQSRELTSMKKDQFFSIFLSPFLI